MTLNIDLRVVTNEEGDEVKTDLIMFSRSIYLKNPSVTGIVFDASWSGGTKNWFSEKKGRSIVIWQNDRHAEVFPL